jgi:hypothetical protein
MGTEDFQPKSSSDRFCTQCFNCILEQLIVEMERQHEACSSLSNCFSFLVYWSLGVEELTSQTKSLVAIYPNDLEDVFTDELVLFGGLYSDKSCVADMLKNLVSDKLISTFSNVLIALRIYLAVLGTNCEGVCLFSKLKLIKIAYGPPWYSSVCPLLP